MKALKQIILSAATLLLLSSCGKSLDDNSSSKGPEEEQSISQNEVVASDGSNIQGFYAAELIPVNFNLHFMKVGAAGLERVGDQFSAFVKLKYGHKGISHKQAVYTGRRCPTIQDDLNKDAYIDIKEALAALGNVTIPLDGNIDAQYEGQSQHPTGDMIKGAYFYERTGSFTRLFGDLKSEDQNPDDNVIKLTAEDGLTFPGRVVLIQGASEKSFLPPTVATVGEEAVHESIPVACGVLWKVEERPADLNP